MWRFIAVIALCMLTFPAVCQSTSKYQIATILEVNPLHSAGEPASEASSFNISVRVGDTIYVVLYTTPLGEVAPKYVAGRQMLVLVGKSAITYNDILGRSLQVPIKSQRPATEATHPK